MTDFQTMYDRIEDQIKRTDLRSNVKDQIVSAIDHYKYQRFDWNEELVHFDTVASTDSYATGFLDSSESTVNASDILEIDDAVLYDDGGTRYPLKRETFMDVHWLRTTNSSESRPYYYQWGARALYLYPTPDAAYSIYMHCLTNINDVTSSSAGSATNAWFTKGEELIRAAALFNLYSYVLHNDQQASRFAQLAARAFQRLKAAYEKKSIGNDMMLSSYL